MLISLIHNSRFIIPYKGGVLYMVFVKKQPGDSDDSIIRKFQRKVMTEGIVQEAKNRREYLKPSLKKKAKAKEAQKARKRIASY